MVKLMDLFLERINNLVDLYQNFLLSFKTELSEKGKTSASKIEQKIYQLRQKVLDFDNIQENQKRNDKKEGEKNNG